MQDSSGEKNRSFTLRGTCAIIGLGVLGILLLPRSCGDEPGLRTGGGSQRVEAAPIREMPPPVPGPPAVPETPSLRPEGDRQPPGAEAPPAKGPPVVVETPDRRPPAPVRDPGVRPARRRKGAATSPIPSQTFSSWGAGGWAQGSSYIRQGEFAVLLLEVMRLPKPAEGWDLKLAACTLAANVGCGDEEIVAMRRQAPFLGEEDLTGGAPLPTPAGVWVGEKPVMPSSGWRVHEFLTEGEMVDLLGQLGIQVYSAQPEELVSWQLARRVLAKFHELLVPQPEAPANLIGRHGIQPPRGNPAPRSSMSAFIP